MGYLAITNAIDHGNGIVEEHYHEGTIIWRKDGITHRIGGPAMIKPNGELHWMEEGKHHRLDGPAVIYPDGKEDWYINGGCLIGEELKAAKERFNLHKDLNKDLPEKFEADKIKKPKV